MEEIRRGLEANIDVFVYAKSVLSSDQMFQIRVGLLENLDVSKYAKSKLNWLQIREKLLKESTLK